VSPWNLLPNTCCHGQANSGMLEPPTLVQGLEPYTQLAHNQGVAVISVVLQCDAN
jgi:hypothetical protein